MTDRPSIEHQLADVIAGEYSRRRVALPSFFAPGAIAAAIIAAVNDGTCNPIVPAGKVVVDAEVVPGNWETTYSSLLYERDDLLAELAELRALKARVDGTTTHPSGLVDVPTTWREGFLACLAWLQETNDD